MNIFVIVLKSANKPSTEKPNKQEWASAGVPSHRMNSNFFTSHILWPLCYVAIIVHPSGEFYFGRGSFADNAI